MPRKGIFFLRSEKRLSPLTFSETLCDERDRLMIVDRISVLAIQTINNAKREIFIKNACYSKQMIIFTNKITSVLC